jgi:hypothetical protein
MIENMKKSLCAEAGRRSLPDATSVLMRRERERGFSVTGFEILAAVHSSVQTWIAAAANSTQSDCVCCGISLVRVRQRHNSRGAQ